VKIQTEPFRKVADATAADVSGDAMAAYGQAMQRMHGPMMQGISDPDPDAAFVHGMIPHHQGAIDMAEIVLRYGKDESLHDLALHIIEAQEREIEEMRAWLSRRETPDPRR